METWRCARPYTRLYRGGKIKPPWRGRFAAPPLTASALQTPTPGGGSRSFGPRGAARHRVVVVVLRSRTTSPRPPEGRPRPGAGRRRRPWVECAKRTRPPPEAALISPPLDQPPPTQQAVCAEGEGQRARGAACLSLSLSPCRTVDIRLPAQGNSRSHGARPGHSRNGSDEVDLDQLVVHEEPPLLRALGARNLTYMYFKMR